MVNRLSPSHIRLAPTDCVRGNPAGSHEVHHGRKPEQHHERRIPRRVEEVARQQEIEFLDPPGDRQVVYGEDRREKHDEGKRIEQHGEESGSDQTARSVTGRPQGKDRGEAGSAPPGLFAHVDTKGGLAHDLVGQGRIGRMETAGTHIAVEPLKLVGFEEARNRPDMSRAISTTRLADSTAWYLAATIFIGHSAP